MAENDHLIAKRKKVKLLKKTFHRPYLTAGQAARHCQVSIPAFKRWVREGRLVAFRTPAGTTGLK